MARSDAVHDHDVMPFADQEVDDMRADEARTARDEHVHAGALRDVPRVRNAALAMGNDGIGRWSIPTTVPREVSDS
jgi:hypothetical protein